MTAVCYYLFSLIILHFLIVQADEGLGCNDPTIEILISPMMSRDIMREIELLWNVKRTEPRNDWVALYDEDPKVNPKAHMLFRRDVDNSQNWVKTNIEEKHNFTSLPFKSVCLGYWAVYWRRGANNNSTKIAQSCLKTFPTWMEDARSEIQGLNVKEMYIPGTHDSAAYIIAHHPFKETVFQKYVYTQDEDIMTQLIMGARYFDIRVGLYDGVYWANHGVVSVNLLYDVLTTIKQFIDNTNEIIVMDFHRFPVGFRNESDHVDLANYVIKDLGDYMVDTKFGWSTRLEDIWRHSQGGKKRIIVSFNNKLITNQYRQYIWPQVSHVWADTHRTEKLFSHLRQHMVKGKTNFFWAAMAELTPNVWSVMRYPKGLREMAYKINKDVTTLFQGEWGKYCNIVAVDFLRSTGIVRSAIKWNKCHAMEL